MLTHINIIAKYTLIESGRNRLLLLLTLIMLGGFFMVEFVGNLTLTEHRQTQVALLAAFMRLAAVALMSLFAVSSSIRELHDKMMEMVLALPVHRYSYYLGKLTGFVIVAGLIACLFGLELLIYAEPEPVFVWCLSLWFELVLVSAISLLMVFSFKQIPSALAGVLVIYSASRVIASLTLMAAHPIIKHTAPAEIFMDSFITSLGWVLPDLSRFTQTQWLLAGVVDASILIPQFFSTAVYLALLSMIALFDFYRKNF